jgi:hypothetical protein
LPILTPAGLGRVNALFQLNPDPYATSCGSMKILGIETFLLRSQSTNILGKINPLKKHTEKIIFAKNGVIFGPLVIANIKSLRSLLNLKVK